VGIFIYAGKLNSYVEYQVSRKDISKDVLHLRKVLVFLLLVALVLQVPTSGEAANWVKVSWVTSGSPKVIMYVDTESIQTTKAGAREAWTKITYDPPKDTTDGAGRKVSLGYSFNFMQLTADRYFCTQELVEYYTNGSSESFTGNCNLKKVAPGSLVEGVWKAVFK
jgi:hypothetical protein